MVVVFGSLNVDFVMRTERLPSPGETVLGGSYFLVQGGKGANQACAAARGGAGRVAMVGCVGEDDWAAFAVQKLEGAGVDLSAVHAGAEPTGCASILVDARGENAIAVASGANLVARADQIPPGWLSRDSVVLLQMEVPVEQNWEVVRRAAQAGARVVLNVAPASAVPADVLDAVDVLLVNEIEARATAAHIGHAEADPHAVAASLAAAHGLLCVITLGARGAIAVGEEGAWQVAALPVVSLDTTGAGDAFAGILGAALDGGAGTGEALRRAAVGAALACTRAGAQSSFPEGAEIDAHLLELPEPERLP